MRSKPARAAVFTSLLSCGVFACDRPPSDAGARDWTPQDHDHADEKSKVMSGNSSGPRAPRGERGERGEAGARDETAALVELTWQKQCSTCHGPEGRGDGPQGAMFKAPDLTQSKTADEAMVTTISSGKGAMPRFDLPPEIVRGLVARIRTKAP